MSINVSVDQIADAMVTQLAAKLVPTAGNPVTTARPVYTAQRYEGAEFTTEEGFKRGIAGRTPALRVRPAGTRTLRTTIGRRRDRVESMFSVICATDSHRSRDDRKSIEAVAEAVRLWLGARQLALAVTPLRYRETRVVRDDAQLLALAVTFAVRHRVDYTIDPGTDTMVDAFGQIVNAANTRSPQPHAPTVAILGTAGTTAYGWALVGVDVEPTRPSSVRSPAASTGPATLNGTNFARLSWTAMAGIVSYEVHRVSSSGTPSTTGRIATTALLTLDDTGLAVLEATAPDELHVDMHDVFP